MNTNFKVFLYCAIGFLFGAINNVLYKFLHRLPSSEIVTFRYFFATLITVSMVRRTTTLYHTRNIFLHFFRGLIVLGTIFSYVIGFRTTYLSTGTLICAVIPFWAMFFSKIILKEEIKKYRLIILSLILIVVIYSTEISEINFNSGSIILLLGTVCSGLYDALNKKCTNMDKPITALLYLNIFAFLISLIIAIKSMILPTFEEVFLLFLLGLGSNILTIFLLKALENSDASFISPFRYLEFVYSVILGKIIFNENASYKIYVASLLIVILQIILVKLEKSDESNVNVTNV